MTSSEETSSDSPSACVAWRSLVRRSLEAWDPTLADQRTLTGFTVESSLQRYIDLDDFLNKSGQMFHFMFWFFQRREAFLSQRTMTKWSRDRLDDYILLPACEDFVTRDECFFVSHFWHSHNDPDPGGKYLRRLQFELALQPWSYIWTDWTCLPQDPRRATEETYFLRALETMPAIIRYCGFTWHYPSFKPRLWILYEMAEYTLTCTNAMMMTEDNKDFLQHVPEMRQKGVRATLSKHGYTCTFERDKEIITSWLELLVLLHRLLVDIGNIRHILDNLTWFPITGTWWINIPIGTVELHPFEGVLALGGTEYRFTPFPQWRNSSNTTSAPPETQPSLSRDDNKDGIDQEGPKERIVRYRYRHGVLCME